MLIPVNVVNDIAMAVLQSRLRFCCFVCFFFTADFTLMLLVMLLLMLLLLLLFIYLLHTHRIDVEEKLDEVGSLCTKREESLILSESAGRGRVSVFPLPSRYASISSMQLQQLHLYMGRFWHLTLLVYSQFILHITFQSYSHMHHSYCHVICQDPCTCYQLLVMAHNVMLSVPSLAAGCQGVLRGETPQLEYGH